MNIHPCEEDVSYNPDLIPRQQNATSHSRSASAQIERQASAITSELFQIRAVGLAVCDFEERETRLAGLKAYDRFREEQSYVVPQYYGQVHCCPRDK